MSYYPSPYQPPQVPYPLSDYHAGYSDPRARARRAAVLMFVIGGLAMSCGAFFALAGAVITPEMLASTPQGAQLREMEAQLGGISFRTYALRAAVLLLAPAMLYIGLGLWVRRGRGAAIISALTLAGLTGLYALASLAGLLLQGGNAANLIAGLCMVFVLLALCGVLVAWLIAALRAAPQVAAMQQQYQMQYWQSQQLQQNYGAGGYGYGMPAPPVAPPPAPQPPPSDHASPGNSGDRQ